MRMTEQRFAPIDAQMGVRQGSIGWWRLLAVGAAVIAAGCASTGGVTAESPAALKEKAVAERVNGRWEALIKRDYSRAYEYLSPASRESTSLPTFQAKIEAIQYKAVNINKIDCEAEVCKVTVNVTYDFPPAKIKGVATLLDENWIIDQGQAWFVYRG